MTSPRAQSSTRVSAVGGVGSFFVDTSAKRQWQAVADPWIVLVNAAGTGPGLVKFEVGPNPGGLRSGHIHVTGIHQPSIHTVSQVGSGVLRVQSDAVLELPFLTTPRILEVGMAAKFIAKEVSELPGVFKLIGLVVAEVAVLLAGIATIFARAAQTGTSDPRSRDYYRSLAEPAPLWQLPGLLGELLPLPLATRVPITTIFIGEETIQAMLYIALAVVDGQQ
jgi:hypothetical protein